VGDPSFRLVVLDSQGDLPADTVLKVLHGAGCEQYAPRVDRAEPCTPDDRAGVVFCDGAAAPGAAGAGPSAAGEFACDIYSEGAATVEVWVSSEPRVHSELSAKSSSCGPLTVEVTVDLADYPEP
jgi:hypothetical protein